MATCEKCKVTYSVLDKDATDMLCSRCSTGKPPESPELNESDQIAAMDKTTSKTMTETDDNNQPSKQKMSYLAICSLALSICGVFCFSVLFIILGNPACCIWVLAVACWALASILGIAALIQRSRCHRRQWWLAIVGISISVMSLIQFIRRLLFLFSHPM